MHFSRPPLGLIAARAFCAGPSVAVALFVTLTATVFAADSPVTVNDCKLTLEARKALLGDRVLEPHSIGVSVKRRVATVWGAVPEKKLAERAIDKVRRVQGIVEVIDRIAIEAPLFQTFPSRPSRPPIERVKPKEPARPPAVQPQWQPAQPEYVTRPVLPKLGATVALPNAGVPTPGKGVSLLPPKSQPATKLPLASDADTELSQAVANLCRASVRYRYVRTEESEGVVRLHGSVVRGEDLFTLAQACGRLPGVTRVVVDGVRIDPLLQIGR